MRALIVAAALVAGLAAPSFAGQDPPPGTGCHVEWGEMAEPTSEPLPVKVPWPTGVECY